LDGFGIAMFIPILEYVGGGQSGDRNMGQFQFLITGIEFLGLTINLVTISFVLGCSVYSKGNH
jgi:hypothetical protein